MSHSLPLSFPLENHKCYSDFVTCASSFAHIFIFDDLNGDDRVPGCYRIADLSLKIVFWTHKFAVGLNDSLQLDSMTH